jgi:hypothetical protein
VANILPDHGSVKGFNLRKVYIGHESTLGRT